MELAEHLPAKVLVVEQQIRRNLAAGHQLAPDDGDQRGVSRHPSKLVCEVFVDWTEDLFGNLGRRSPADDW